MTTDGPPWTLAPAHLPWWVCGASAPVVHPAWAACWEAANRRAEQEADALDAQGYVSDRTWAAPGRALSVAIAVRAHEAHEAVAAWVSEVRAGRVRPPGGGRFGHLLWATPHGERALRASRMVAAPDALALTVPGPEEDGLDGALEGLRPVLDRTLVVVSGHTSDAVHDAISRAFDAARVDLGAARIALGPEDLVPHRSLHRVVSVGAATRAGLIDPGVALGLGLQGVSVGDWQEGVTQADAWRRGAQAPEHPVQALAAWTAQAGRQRLFAVAREARLAPLQDRVPALHGLPVEACLGDPAAPVDAVRLAARASRANVLGTVPAGLGLRQCDARGVGGWLALWAAAAHLAAQAHR